MGLFDATQTALERALEGTSLRQQVLSNNISNANTPGFKRSDVDFHGALEKALEGGASSDALASAPLEIKTDTASSIRADGNNVDIDQEMSNLAQNSLEYQALIGISKARLQMISTVIGGR